MLYVTSNQTLLEKRQLNDASFISKGAQFKQSRLTVSLRLWFSG